MLKAERDESGDWKDDGRHFAADPAPSITQPNCETDVRVAEDAGDQFLQQRQTGLVRLVGVEVGMIVADHALSPEGRAILAKAAGHAKAPP